VLHSLATNPELLGDGGPVRTDFVQRSAGDPNSNEFAAAPSTVSGPPIRPRNAAPPSSAPPGNNAPPMNMPGQGSMGALTELTNPGKPNLSTSPTDRTSEEAASQLATLSGQGSTTDVVPATRAQLNLRSLTDPRSIATDLQTGNEQMLSARQTPPAMPEPNNSQALGKLLTELGVIGAGVGSYAMMPGRPRPPGPTPPAPVAAQPQPVVPPLPQPNQPAFVHPTAGPQTQPVINPNLPTSGKPAIPPVKPVNTTSPRPNILTTTQDAAAEAAQKQNLANIMLRAQAGARGARGNINTTTQPPAGPIGAALSTGGIGGPGGSPDLTLQNILTGKGVGRMALQ
jgi:hypothetical protein